MKKNVLVVGLALLTLLFQACRDDESVTKGSVQFNFNASELHPAGGRKLSELPEGSVLLVSLTNATGVVYTLKELPLNKHEDHYISDPLILPHGNYSITDFIVADADRQVLYATPKAGSPTASLVDHPLPMAFNVGKVEVTDIPVEIISVDTHEAEDLGYASFEISIVDVASFKLSAYARAENGNFALSGAQLFILHGADTVHRQYIQPIVNTIFFASDPDEFYTVVLIEPSFAKYTNTLRLHDLNETLGQDILSIRLEPALTVVTNPFEIEGQYRFSFYLTNHNPSAGNVSIDWGDGIIEEIDLQHGCCGELGHIYASAGDRFISVSGDLNTVTHLQIEYDNPVKSISLKHLTELKSVSIVATRTPETIDISFNTKLETAAFGMTQVTSVDVSKNIHLKNLFLVYMTNFSVASMNQIISDLHQHAQDHQVTGGWITMVDVDGGPIGPLTEESVTKLYDLQDNYGWMVEPSLE